MDPPGIEDRTQQCCWPPRTPPPLEREQRGRTNGLECEMIERFGSVPGAELMDKNRPHLGKPGMKLNSRAVAIALPVGHLPISRNALVMRSGGGGGVEERASVEGTLTLQGLPHLSSVPCYSKYS